MKHLKRILALVALLCAMPVFAADTAKAPRVEMKTSEGTIVLELYPDKAPITVANFLQYVRDGFYNDLIFHRVIDGFMIQGGGYKADMSMKPPRAPIVNEAQRAIAAGLKNEAGTIAMARTSDPNSASAQFFINLVANDALDYPGQDGYGYAVFGKVVSGFDVVQKIGKTKTGYSGFNQNVPKTPIVINSASILAAGK